MIAVVRSAGVTVANRALQLVVQSPQGFLVDIHSAEFQVFDTSSAAREAAPVQVLPVAVNERQAVDMVAHRIGVGRYVGSWTPAADASLGRYVVRWFYKTTATAEEQSFDQEFELVSRAYGGPVYCTLYDLVAAGMVSAGTDDGVAQRLIVEASRYVELYTGRQFYPVYKSVTVGGRHGHTLRLEEPIVAIEGVNTDFRDGFVSVDRDQTAYRVFNRHLSQNLFNPDDRGDPKLEFLHGWGNDYSHWRGEPAYYERFSTGVHNVRVTGIFGYTEPDGSFVGVTPQLIRLATKLLCFKQQHPAGSLRRQDQLRNGRLKSEYTRDQGYILADPGDVRGSPFVTHTLDPEIDAILHGFRRPAHLGAA
jgi:hypothetical protein